MIHTRQPPTEHYLGQIIGLLLDGIASVGLFGWCIHSILTDYVDIVIFSLHHVKSQVLILLI